MLCFVDCENVLERFRCITVSNLLPELKWLTTLPSRVLTRCLSTVIFYAAPHFRVLQVRWYSEVGDECTYSYYDDTVGWRMYPTFVVKFDVETALLFYTKP